MDPNAEDALEVRRIQNRMAQRRFRHRKQVQQKTIEATNVHEQAFGTGYSDVESQGLVTGDVGSSPASLHNSSIEYAIQYASGALDPMYGDALLLDGITFPNQRSTIASPPGNISTNFQHAPSLPASSNAAVENEVPHHHTPCRSSSGNLIDPQPLAYPSPIATAIQDLYSLSQTTSPLSTSTAPSFGHSPASSSSSTSISTLSGQTPISNASSCIGAGGWLSPLHIAAQKGHDRILRALLQHDVDPNEPDSEGLTPLIHAVIGGHEDVVCSLLLLGAIVGDGHYRPSALHYAVQHRRETLLRVLLNHCARERMTLIDACDESGQTPLHVAIDMDFETGVLMLLQAGANPRLKARRM